VWRVNLSRLHPLVLHETVWHGNPVKKTISGFKVETMCNLVVRANFCKELAEAEERLSCPEYWDCPPEMSAPLYEGRGITIQKPIVSTQSFTLTKNSQRMDQRLDPD
jgi:hypothetical protein